MIANTLHDLGIVALSIVGICWRHVCEDLRSVYATPIESRVGKCVDVIPRKLIELTPFFPLSALPVKDCNWPVGVDAVEDLPFA